MQNNEGLKLTSYRPNFLVFLGHQIQCPTELSKSDIHITINYTNPYSNDINADGMPK